LCVIRLGERAVSLQYTAVSLQYTVVHFSVTIVLNTAVRAVSHTGRESSAIWYRCTISSRRKIRLRREVV